ncbi:MAG TPA: tetratricopeptide repeat protein [Terracidiphilus sp.]|nr:tetratricopeptide repeat protein [Terracidiphilus sp.]
MVEALPLYEDLAKAHPDQSLYFKRLADCLVAQAAQLSDISESRAVAARMRDAAKRAVELGETAEYVKMMANFDPNQPINIVATTPAMALMAEAEKAFTAGDFPTAMAKYSAAAEADPKLYEAALYAGDTAFEQKDLKTAAQWFAKAIAIDPNRETAYRYWGDAIKKYSGDPLSAKGKFIDAIVAEPYNKLAWQGIQQWAQLEKAVILAPKIDRPAGPVVDAKKPNNITINIAPDATDEKKHPGGYAWLGYSMARAAFRGDGFKQAFPNEKEYRHSLKEEDTALSAVAEIIKEGKIKPDKLDESLRNLVELSDAGMLDCWILINGADNGIAQDYDAYRKEHRQLLHDYLEKFVVHGGVNPAQ